MAKQRLPQRLPQIKVPPMTAEEKQMWKEYAQARKADSPQALRAWARKHKVKLLPRNRVGLKMSYRSGSGAPAPSPSGTAARETCNPVCGIRRFSRWSRLAGIVADGRGHAAELRGDDFTSEAEVGADAGNDGVTGKPRACAAVRTQAVDMPDLEAVEITSNSKLSRASLSRQ
jgi:hypothetical protein